MTVESHNEYQSNIVMNRSFLMAVKVVKQTQRSSPHDTSLDPLETSVLETP